MYSMINSHMKTIYLILFICFAIGCKSTSPITTSSEPQEFDDPSTNHIAWDAKAPYVLEEFRAAWVATVANISWPSKPGLSSQQQKEEALKLLDYLANQNYNAVIFQVRPQSDALYPSELEPW